MAKNPSSIFYWVDWTSDLALRKCTAAAQGMWMQMLAIAAEAGGYVKVGNDPCSICDLAEITGWDKRNVSKWVRELERKGVSSRTEDGVIYCRRMVREAEARAAKRAKGVSGVRRTKASERHPHDGINQPDLLDNPTLKTEKCAPSYSDSGSYASSQTPSLIVEPSESFDAAREPEATEGQEIKTNAEQVSKRRFAPSEQSPPPERDPEATGRRRSQILTLRRWSQHSPHLPDEERGHRLAMLARATQANNRDAWHGRSEEDRLCYDALARKAARLPLDEQTLAWIRMAERPDKGGLWRSKEGWKHEIQRGTNSIAQYFAAHAS